jgi:uncharacterized membrane protein YhhN
MAGMETQARSNRRLTSPWAILAGVTLGLVGGALLIHPKPAVWLAGTVIFIMFWIGPLLPWFFARRRK